MNSISRSFSELRQNIARTILVTLLLSLSISLSLILFIAATSSSTQIRSLKEKTGTELMLVAGGGQQFSMGEGGMATSKPLEITEQQITAIEGTPNIKNVKKGIRVDGFGANNPKNQNATNSSLTAPTSAELGQPDVGMEFPQQISLTGVADNGKEAMKNDNLDPTKDMPFQGQYLPEGASKKALVSRAVADKNSLTLGSKFLLYNQEFEIIGTYGQPIYTGPQKKADLNNPRSQLDGELAGIIVPVTDVQNLAGIKTFSDVTPVVNSIDNVDQAVKDVQKVVGTSAKVSPPLNNSQALIDSLSIVQGSIWFGFFVAVIVSGLVIFFVMFLLVRSRRKDIGIFKAIGGRTRSLVLQYSTTGVTIVTTATVLATITTGLLAETITRGILGGVKASPATGAVFDAADEVGPPATTNLNTEDIFVNSGQVWVGLAVVLLVTLLGVTIPVALASRIRPADAMRQE